MLATIKTYGIIAAVLFTMACEKESSIETSALVSPSEVEAIFESFEAEAAKRGINISIATKEIYAVFDDLPDNKIGQCSYTSHSPRKITLDRTYWQRAGSIDKEYLVFHELGHCYLERSHDDSQNSLGNCNSIMNSGTSDCRNNYSARNRNLYLDELFGVK